jgi:hypothetical protein
MKCEEDKVIVFGEPSEDVTCLGCKRRGRVNARSVRSDVRTFFSPLASAPCSLLKAEEELEQLNEEYKQCELKLETTLFQSFVSAPVSKKRQRVHKHQTPEPLHCIRYKEPYESEYLGTCDEKGGTIKSVATCDDGSHMLLVVFTQVDHGERWISSRDEKLTILFDLPKFNLKDYYPEERLADLLAPGAAQLEQSSALAAIHSNKVQEKKLAPRASKKRKKRSPLKVSSDEESDTSVPNQLTTATRPSRKRRQMSY